MPLVRIKPGLSHGYFDAATQAHAYHQAGDEFDASPAEMESFGDKFEPAGEDLEQDVWKILAAAGAEYAMPDESESPVVEINATKGAIGLAQEHGVSLTLSDIVGTGTGGRIIKADVQAALDGNAE